MFVVLLFAAMILGGIILYSKLNKNLKQKDKNTKYYATVQDNLPVESIRKGLARLKDGTFLKILEITPRNINLLEGSELATLQARYKSSLHNLDFFTQFLQQSRSVDIKDYYQKIERMIFETENKFNKKQLEFYLDFCKEMVQNNS